MPAQRRSQCPNTAQVNQTPMMEQQKPSFDIGDADKVERAESSCGDKEQQDYVQEQQHNYSNEDDEDEDDSDDEEDEEEEEDGDEDDDDAEEGDDDYAYPYPHPSMPMSTPMYGGYYQYNSYYPPPYYYGSPNDTQDGCGAYHPNGYTDLSAMSDPIPDNRRNRGGVSEAFPAKLHRMLNAVEHDGLTEIIGFFSHGRAFAIHKPKLFVDKIMPRFFRQTRLTSFQRQLNLYGFRRISQGPDNGGYYHELFLKGRPGLCINMKRTKIKGNAKFKRDPESEPNFYKMRPITSPPAPLPPPPPYTYSYYPPYAPPYTAAQQSGGPMPMPVYQYPHPYHYPPYWQYRYPPPPPPMPITPHRSSPHAVPPATPTSNSSSQTRREESPPMTPCENNSLELSPCRPETPLAPSSPILGMPKPLESLTSPKAPRPLDSPTLSAPATPISFKDSL